MTRLAGLLLVTGVLMTGSACGSSHRSAAYSGRLYSVGEVRRTFAALGLELHRGQLPAPGFVYLVNNARLGPQRIPSAPRVVRVFVRTRRQASEKTHFERGRNTQVTRYANVTVFSDSAFLLQVRSAVSALRWGTASSLGKPRRGLIVFGNSIDRIRLDELRTNVEKELGAGRSSRRGLVSYFGGHLLVDYWACTRGSSTWRRAGAASALDPESTSGRAGERSGLSTRPARTGAAFSSPGRGRTP